jgi:hypothetical protein
MFALPKKRNNLFATTKINTYSAWREGLVVRSLPAEIEDYRSEDRIRGTYIGW